ncbi:MAG: TetR/AcrR family transcriptional regulator [Deltaproteobacteria bacterium]|nr:TetR/AcrR family transcriptional regulator [Deltaproteobacteria bacterium]
MPRDTLENIASEKKERILREAAILFAERGYSQTDMAELARRCRIAKGSLYNYFENKEELYVFVCRDGLSRSREAVWESAPAEANIFELVEHVFAAGVRFAREHPEYVSLYLHVASSGLEHFARRLSVEVEKPTADRLKDTLRAGIEAGLVDTSIDVPQVAWQINNTYVMLLTALVSQHFGTRLREYLEVGEPDVELSDDQVETLRERALDFIRFNLRPTA